MDTCWAVLVAQLVEGRWSNPEVSGSNPVGVKDFPRGGGLPYETDGDARRKIRIKPLKETNLGVAQALFEP